VLHIAGESWRECRGPIHIVVSVEGEELAGEVSSRSTGNAGGSESSVAGVLSKWTNYDKGWRSRWFVLRNSIVSYAKIRRPKNLNLLAPATDDVRLIGEISADRLSRMDSGRLKHRKDVGIVHLKVL
jgi:hypothetical protein